MPWWASSPRVGLSGKTQTVFSEYAARAAGAVGGHQADQRSTRPAGTRSSAAAGRARRGRAPRAMPAIASMQPSMSRSCSTSAWLRTRIAISVKNEPTSSRSLRGVSSSASASRTGSRCSGRARPDDDRRHARMRQQPREREPGHADAARRPPRPRAPSSAVVDVARCRSCGTAPGAASCASPRAAPRRAGTCRSASRPRAGRTPGSATPCSAQSGITSASSPRSRSENEFCTQRQARRRRAPRCSSPAPQLLSPVRADQAGRSTSSSKRAERLARAASSGSGSCAR